MKNETLAELEVLFLALSDKTRLKLLGLMANGPVSVGYLADSLGLSQPKISRHLAYLRSSGLVSTRRDGKWVYYGIEQPSGMSARRLLNETLAELVGEDATLAQAASPANEKPLESDAVHQELEIYLL